MDLPLADDDELRRAADLIEALAARHGLSGVRLGERTGEVVVTAEPGRDYFDLVQFELEAAALMRAEVRAVSSGAPGSRPRGALRSTGGAAA